MSPIAQVAPIQLVRGMAMRHVECVAHLPCLVDCQGIVHLVHVVLDVRRPCPRRRSLKKAVLLVPSVMLARLTQLRL